jgi:hypothetical protein
MDRNGHGLETSCLSDGRDLHGHGQEKRVAAPARQAISASGRSPATKLYDDRKIMDFLSAYVGKFDMYVEDDYAIFVRYCFQEQADAEVFRARFETKGGVRFKLAS